MKTPKEYLKEAQELMRYGILFSAQKETVYRVIATAQIEAYNEALRDAVKHHRLSYDTDGISGGVSYFLVEDSILKLLKK
jgi:hypothetical protein